MQDELHTRRPRVSRKNVISVIFQENMSQKCVMTVVYGYRK